MPGYFPTGEHVNITQWESSHSLRAAFLFMSLNSINGLLSRWTVVVPRYSLFLSEVLVAAAEKCYPHKGVWHRSPPSRHLLRACLKVVLIKPEGGFCGGLIFSCTCSLRSVYLINTGKKKGLSSTNWMRKKFSCTKMFIAPIFV